ncbi:MAG: hypothetical protein Kow00121_41450 [Elainellaceae cyanobacterium]
MTAGDFIPGDPNNTEEPSYPKLFGVSLTPTVLGILAAVLGLIGAIWLWLNVVQPAAQQNQQLRQDVEAKRQQLQNQEETQQQIEAARARLVDAQQLQAEVLSLFATDRSIDTLLLDVNERVQSANSGIQDPNRRAALARFDLNEEASGVITDSSYGEAVNNNLERRVYDVEVQGSFPQVVSIIRSIERLQPLLVVRNLNSELDTSTQRLVLDNQGRVVPTGQPETRITTSFQLAALVPIDQEEPADTAGQGEASPSPSPTQ